MHILMSLACLALVLLFVSADKPDKPTMFWTKIKGSLVALKDETIINKVIKSRDLSPKDSVFLFETGDYYSYTYKANTLRLILGKKELTVDKDTTLNIPCLYPEAKNTIDLPFRFFPTPNGARFSEAVPSGTSQTSYSYHSKSVLIFPLEKSEIIFFDWNHNGYFDDFEDDRYIILPPNTFQKKDKSVEEWEKSLQPFKGFFTTENQGSFVAGIKPAWELNLWKVSNTLKQNYLEHMGYLNHLRKLQGAGFVGIDETLIPACEKHCHYCSVHGLCHEEDNSKPEFTAEGSRAGLSSVVGTHNNPVEGLKGMFRTLYHRNPFLIPGLRNVSLGCIDGIYVCDIHSFSSGGTSKPIYYPFPRQTDVATRASGETPNEIPDDMTGEEVGTLIAIRFPDGWAPKFHSATLINTKTKQEVPLRFTDASSVPREARQMFPTNDSCIALFPKQNLDEGIIYEITLNYFNSPLDAKRNKPPLTVKWRFKTQGEPKEPESEEENK